MEENLISKKELLAFTGISYGSLYRWKRKQLIPDEWFIKKSTFTGPETFFPRDQVLERIAKIQEMKEDLSLDDLAKTFSGAPPELHITPPRLIADGLLSGAVAGLSLFSDAQELDFYGALYLTICDRLLAEGHLSLPETDSVLAHLLAGFKNYTTAPVLSIYRKMGVAFSVLSDETATLSVDDGAKPVICIHTAADWETLKSKLGAEQ